MSAQPLDRTAVDDAAETGPPTLETRSSAIRRGAVGGTRAAVPYIIVIAIVAVFLVVMDLVHVISLPFVIQAFPSAIPPLRTSAILTVVSFVLGFAAALPLGLVRAYGRGILRRRKGAVSEVVSYRRARELYGPWKGLRVAGAPRAKKAAVVPFYGFANGLVEAMRGTPFLVQTFLVFNLLLFVIPKVQFLGGDVFFWSGLVALTLNTAGYQAEVMRAGFQSVGQGQIEAAKSIGLKGRQVFAHITFPQSLRLVLLPLTNEFISLFKASTILSYIAVYELFHWSEDLGQKFGHPIEGFLMISIVYLAINIPLGRGISYIEQKKRIPGLGTPMRETKGPRPTFWQPRRGGPGG